MYNFFDNWIYCNSSVRYGLSCRAFWCLSELQGEMNVIHTYVLKLHHHMGISPRLKSDTACLQQAFWLIVFGAIKATLSTDSKGGGGPLLNSLSLHFMPKTWITKANFLSKIFCSVRTNEYAYIWKNKSMWRMKYFLASLWKYTQKAYLPKGFSEFLHFNQNISDVTAYCEKRASNTGRSINILFSSNNAKKWN